MNTWNGRNPVLNYLHSSSYHVAHLGTVTRMAKGIVLPYDTYLYRGDNHFYNNSYRWLIGIPQDESDDHNNKNITGMETHIPSDPFFSEIYIRACEAGLIKHADHPQILTLEGIDYANFNLPS